MNINKKILFLTHLTILLLGALAGYYFVPKVFILEVGQTSGYQDAFNPPEDNVEVIIKHGLMTLTQEGHNTWTTIGKRFHRNFLWFHNITGTNNNNNATFGFIGWVSLGNATVAATLTKLTTEATTAGATRKAFDTVVPYNNATYTSIMANGTVTFTFTGTIRLDAVGFNWMSTSDSDNNLYSAFALASATTFNTDDQLIVKYYHRSDGT